ncbi:MAG TPA: LLM class flavin-dependent oxidoreductase [Baekduia sp.]|nr:LLM class flavin-dependent oxidoreductase [Baekduia sp.]
MKFGLWFNTMVPKPLDADDWEPGQEVRRFAETVEQIETADRLGYDYAFVGEHHFLADYAHFSASDMVLAAAARTTSNIRLGTAITQMSHNDPVRVAERMATLDVLSGGRVEFGSGEGGAAEIAPLMDDPSVKKARRMEAETEVLRILASRDLYPGWQGEHFRLPAVNVVPKSVQRPHPPVWLAGARRDQTVEAAQRGMGSQVLSLLGPDDIRDRVDIYWETFRREGRPIGAAANPAVAAFASTHVAATDEEAHRRSREGFAFFGYGLMKAGSGQLVGKPNLHLWRDFVSGVPVGPESTVDLPDPTRAPGSLVGSVDTVRAAVRALEETNVDVCMCTVQTGNTRHDHILESLELFAREIMPDVRERADVHARWRASQLDGIDIAVNSTV